MAIRAYHKTGRQMALNWGVVTDQGLDDHIKGLSERVESKVLMCAMVNSMNEMIKGQERLIAAIGRMPAKIEKEKLKAEMALEKAKQKTAAAQLKAAEAAPPVVTVIQMGSDELQDLERNDRHLVKRMF